MARRGVLIREVEPESPAARIGLCKGDEIRAVNGHAVADELALRFYLADEQVELAVRKAGGGEERLDIDLGEAGRLGIEVEDFETRTCNNACVFCFVNQLPPGVRPNLKVRDDDYRLSFLHGNYVTLTNLSERELDRIIEQALSPLYVSVHATDPLLRARMLGRRKADDLGRKLRKLIDGGIRIHAQIVLMPGINDGARLEETCRSLFDYHPGVHSAAIVPLGLSDHGPARSTFEPVTTAFSRALIGQLRPWQKEFRKKAGRAFAYLADEFYIQAGVPIPAARDYDDFAQIEDGVGMLRRFLDDFDGAMNRPRRAKPGLRGTLVTGALFGPFLKGAVRRLNQGFHWHLGVVAAENHFMGRSITVAGLLAGRDIIGALKAPVPGEFVVIPEEAISRAEGLLVDDLTLPELARILQCPVYPSGRSVEDFFRLLCDL